MQLRFILALSIVAELSSAGPLQIKVEEVTAAQFPFITANVETYCNVGTALTPGDFQLLVNGVPTDSQVVTALGDGAPLNLVLCLDMSGSMKGAPLIALQASARALIRELSQDDRLAVISFADDAVWLSDFSADRALLKSRVDSLRGSGKFTELYYAVHKGVERLAGESNAKRRVLVVMGDGHNESPARSFTEDVVIKEALDANIPIFSIGYSKIEAAHLQSLERLAAATGGTFYRADTDSELERRSGEVYKAVKSAFSRFSIEGKYPTELGDGQSHPIKVLVHTAAKNLTTSDEGTAILPLQVRDMRLYYYGGGAGALLLLCVAVFVIMASSKRKKRVAAELAKHAEEEKRQRDELEAERIRRAEAEARLEEAKRRDSEKATAAKPGATTIEGKSVGGTMILEPGDSSASTLRLEFTSGAYAGKRFDIAQNEVTIGRDSSNTISLQEDGFVSSKHARIRRTAKGFIIEDSNSANGTCINGHRISSHQIAHNDCLQLGRSEAVFQLF